MSKPAVRASCQFCRKRKIKCSGELSGCRACENRDQSCLYEESSQMGRPRKLPSGARDAVHGAIARRTEGKQLMENKVLERPVLSSSAPTMRPIQPKKQRQNDTARLTTFDSPAGVNKIKYGRDIKTTFSQFSQETLGTFAQSFYGFVEGETQASIANDSIKATPYRSKSTSSYCPGSPGASSHTRRYYSSAISSIRSTLGPSDSETERRERVADTYLIWERFGSEIIRYSSIGVPSGRGNGDGTEGEEPLLVRLLKADESVPFGATKPQLNHGNPVEHLDSAELISLLTDWFTLSPYSFLVNDSLLLESIQNGTYDPVLISIMIVFVLSRDPTLFDPPTSSASSSSSNSSGSRSTQTSSDSICTPKDSFSTVDPSLLSQPCTMKPNHTSFATSSESAEPTLPSPFRESSARAKVEPFLMYVEHHLFTRMAEQGATSISTIQSILLLANHYLNTMKCRAAWSLICTGLSCCRENLGRRRADKARGDRMRMESGYHGEGSDRTARELVEDEQSVNLWWMFAIFGSWSFLALDLPRSTILEITDSLPLPPFAFASSPSYIYRQTHPNLSSLIALRSPASSIAVTEGIQGCLKSFNETCRSLSLIIALATKAGVSVTDTGHYRRGPTTMSGSREGGGGGGEEEGCPAEAEEYPMIVDHRVASSSGVWSLFITQWLVQMADQHAARPSSIGSESETGAAHPSRAVPRNAFLSVSHAIMALNQLTPFSSSDGSFKEEIKLEAGGLRLAIQAMELLAKGSKETVRDVFNRGGASDSGQIRESYCKTGLLRLIGDCLPHCLAIIAYLIEASNRSPDTFALFYEKREEIDQLSLDFTSLSDLGLSRGIAVMTKRNVSMDSIVKSESRKTCMIDSKAGIELIPSKDVSSTSSYAQFRSDDDRPATVYVEPRWSQSSQDQPTPTRNSTYQKNTLIPDLPFPYSFDSLLSRPHLSASHHAAPAPTSFSPTSLEPFTLPYPNPYGPHSLLNTTSAPSTSGRGDRPFYHHHRGLASNGDTVAGLADSPPRVRKIRAEWNVNVRENPPSSTLFGGRDEERTINRPPRGLTPATGASIGNIVYASSSYSRTPSVTSAASTTLEPIQTSFADSTSPSTSLFQNAYSSLSDDYISPDSAASYDSILSDIIAEREAIELEQLQQIQQTAFILSSIPSTTVDSRQHLDPPLPIYSPNRFAIPASASSGVRSFNSAPRHSVDSDRASIYRHHALHFA